METTFKTKERAEIVSLIEKQLLRLGIKKKASTPSTGGTTTIITASAAGGGSVSELKVTGRMDLLGTKDGSNTVFASPAAVRRGGNGYPLAILRWKLNDLTPVNGIPVDFQWRLRPDNITVDMGLAPLPGDSLFWLLAHLL